MLLTEQISALWQGNPRWVASLLSLDQAGAFDTTPHIRVTYSLSSRRIPEWFVQIIGIFLLNRKTELLALPSWLLGYISVA